MRTGQKALPQIEAMARAMCKRELGTDGLWTDYIEIATVAYEALHVIQMDCSLRNCSRARVRSVSNTGRGVQRVP